ncbi:S-layer homology domain-containing protein [Anaerotignum lactatifermentans]|uniref:S-layer homology domain-containing protein n=1 Tax=Anaerotignum lactatifermentans TaxID=160404 RepID=UPI00242F1810|nr:S-layer homology domain-containing protein [Anaerotignum lactatifermentans]
MKKRTGKMISLSLAVAMAVTAAPVTALADENTQSNVIETSELTPVQSTGETGTDTTTVDTNEEEGTAWAELTPAEKVGEEEALNALPEVTETEKTVQGEGTKENPYKISTEAELKEAVESGGYLQISDNIEIKNTLVIENDVNLDLNGKTLTCSSEEIGIQVKSGSTLIEDSADNGKITTSNMSTILVKVSAGAEFTLNSGTLENTNGDFSDENVILNYGTLNIDGGVIKGVSCIHANASQYETTAPTEEKSIVNITNGQLIGTPCETDIQHENKYTNISYGLTWFGLGMGEKGIYNNKPNPINDAVVINISGGKISGGQALGTNASSGKYAGFTLNISDDAEIISSNDCAAYLPGYGITKISGGKLSGPQGIRIAAGELNITGGTIEGTSLTDGNDLQSGGSGGTLGAIVVGKASGGYLGNIDVNISNGAVIKNTATNGTDDARPAAIVVSDKNMANSEYENSSINVTTEDIEITGDIIKISNLTSTTTSDGGETVLDINNTTVTGSVINQSKSDLNMTSSTVTGDMANKDKGNTFVSDSTISGTVKNSGTGAVAVTGNSHVNNTENTGSGSIFVEGDASSDVVALVNGKPYNDLQTAVNDAPDNAKITLVKNVEVNHAVTIPAGVTLDSGKNTTITLTAELANGAFITAGGDNVTIRNITINTNGNAKHGVQFYRVKGGEMDKVTVNGGYYTSVIVNGAEATIKNSILNLDEGQGYTNIEFAVGDGVTTVPKVTIENVTVTPNRPVVYMDKTTFDRIQTLSGTSSGITRDELNEQYVKGAFLYYYDSTASDPDDTLPVITFDPTEGSIADSAKTQKINTSGHLASLPTASRSGYRLDGWYTKAEGGDKITTDTLFTENTTVYAQWSKKSSSSSRYDGYITIINPKNGEVSVSDDWANEDEKITLTITPDKGYVVDKIEIVDDEGDKIDAKKVDDKDDKYTFRMANCDVTVTVTFKEEGKTTEDTDKEEDKDDEETTELNFTDVKESDWFFKGVEYVVDKGIMSGVSENEFAPSGKLTRAMLVQMLYNMESRPACDAENAFMDVPVGQWYTDAVIWANDAKIVSGMGEGLFAPNMEITREQMVAMLYNYAKYRGYDVTASADLSAFADTASVSAWAQPAMQWAVAEGYISGMGDSQLAPQGTATRAEIASVIMRFMEATAESAETAE